MREADFPRDEYQQRYRRAWASLRKTGLAALLVMGESNYRYLTGHRTQMWASRSRPLYAVLTDGRPPVVLVTEVELGTVKDSSWLKDIRTWLGFADDSLPVLAKILRELGLSGERVGVDFGEEMRLGLPVPSFQRLQVLCRNVRFVDGSPLLWCLRQIKSSREIAYKRQAFAAAGTAFGRCWRQSRAGMSEHAIHRRMVVAMMEAGADRVGFCPIHSGPGNYTKFTAEPTSRTIRRGDMVWIDAGCSVRGYWSDFNRIAAVGTVSQQQRNAYRRIWEVTRACIEVIRPGIPVSQIVQVRDRTYARLGIVETHGRSGRMGHGSGLDMTEPPSVGSHDHTILEPGMVLHIEPKMIAPYGFFQLEEAVVVTKGGYEYLTPPAPPEPPVIRRGQA